MRGRCPYVRGPRTDGGRGRCRNANDSLPTFNQERTMIRRHFVGTVGKLALGALAVVVPSVRAEDRPAASCCVCCKDDTCCTTKDKPTKAAPCCCGQCGCDCC